MVSYFNLILKAASCAEQLLIFRCSSYSAKHLLLLFGFFSSFFLLLLLLLLPLRPIDCRQKNTYLQTSHELETWHVLRT